ncbi:DUF4301 family protein [Flavobacteriaceae bacterium XHP0103]|uniref:DUF4301 family protein n=1 Tax=Marixanthotalea marina TaxID=2844359 RepID=UPI002989F8CD|nr:DUF4301 family protein [Marixanthotalea marina]MBU3822138.1 DUF4301 family protein [Marixanthotalea marina]
MFTEKDIQQITDHGLTVEQVNKQMETIKSGMTYSNLVDTATVGNGVLKIQNKFQEYIDFYEAKRNSLSVVKFVPASGAASRMFKFLFQFLQDYDPQKENIEVYAKRNSEISVFLRGMRKLPFYETVRNELQKNIPDFEKVSLGEECVLFVKAMLDANGLNYSFYPKGLLPFHKYQDHVSTAFKEHLLESTLYASSNNEANLHFTISEAHTDMFNMELESIKEDLEKETNTRFNVSFSYQNKATDTIAITANDELYRNEDGSLLFRPSGHGALIENLNQLNHDLIFIKNIDNIAVFEQNKSLSDYKKLAAGVLLKIQEQAFKYMRKIDEDCVLEDELHNIELFVINRLNADLGEAYKQLTPEEKIGELRDRINRPIRVCGMVKNEGQPGGGPFWIKEENGYISLEIIEFAQIDADNDDQIRIVNRATHFNPTDLVCGVKDYKGNKFNLTDYVDPKAAFITMKSQNGVDIKAYELPGLWNGSMAHWNSIFVEIPLETFNPVKTVNDLLNPAHQV